MTYNYIYCMESCLSKVLVLAPSLMNILHPSKMDFKKVFGVKMSPSIPPSTHYTDVGMKLHFTWLGKQPQT